MGKHGFPTACSHGNSHCVHSIRSWLNPTTRLDASFNLIFSKAAVLWEVLPYNVVICVISLKKRRTSVYKIENEGSTEKALTVYKTRRCHVGDGHNISVIFHAVRTPYLTFNFVRRFALRHIVLNHKTTTLTSKDLNCYSATQLLFQQNALVFIKSTRYYNLYFLSFYS
jgi:hypothetical protein